MIAVLGGGVAGAALAWSLARRGRRDVVVFDPLPQGSGSTGRAFGGFRTQHGSPVNVALALASRPFFEARADRVGFRPVGYLYVAGAGRLADELDRRAALQRSLGLPVEHPEPRALVPFARTDGRRANYCRLDGVYRPPLVLGCLVEEAAAAGAEFRYGCEASPSQLEAADAVAVCAGSWSRGVGESLGVRLDVEPQERYVLQLGPFDWLTPDTPVTLDLDTGYHFRERDGRMLLMGPGEVGDWPAHRAWLDSFVPAAAGGPPETQWTGLYEVTFDHHPLVGETERPGVWASCGFSGHGVMHAPAVADSLAAMMLGQSPPIDVSPLSPLRTAALVDSTQL